MKFKTLNEWKDVISNFIENRNFLFITLIFWVYLFSGLNSKDTESWLFFTLMKLPFLLFTFAMFNLPSFSRISYYKLYMLYLLILVISTLSIIPAFFGQLESLETIILKGHSIPTPIDHIKYSLFISFGIIAGLIILLSKEMMFFKGEKVILAIILIYLIIFLHLIAVRSGIIILYVNIAVFLANRLLSLKKYWLGIMTIVLILSIPVIAYFTIPTFRAKVHYTSEDYQMSRKDKEMAFSDGERFRSYQVGWELFETSPVTGVGIGDIRKAYSDLYNIKFFTNNPTFLPHNQFLTISVATGVIGLFFFSFGFFFPFIYHNAWKDPFLKALLILMLLSFMVENTIERQYSVGFYLIFLLLGLKQYLKRKGE